MRLVVHHEYQSPFALTSVYTHPLEEMFTLGATISGPLLFSRHILSIWVWITLRLLETLDAHSGLVNISVPCTIDISI